MLRIALLFALLLAAPASAQSSDGGGEFCGSFTATETACIVGAGVGIGLAIAIGWESYLDEGCVCSGSRPEREALVVDTLGLAVPARASGGARPGVGYAPGTAEQAPTRASALAPRR